MFTSLLVLSTLALRALAQSDSATPSTTASADVSAQTSANLLLNTDNAFVASVIDADPSQTTYAIVCTKGDRTFCNPDVTITMTQGPSMVEIQSEVETPNAQLTVFQTCELGGTTSVECTISLGFSLTNTETTSTTTRTWTGEQASRNFQMVPVTGGVEKLQAAATTTGEAGAMATGLVGGWRSGVVKVVVPVLARIVGGMV